MKKIIVVLFFVVFSSSSHANWFGPDNFEECVLDKMKGQNKSMIYTARKACEIKFPYEKKLESHKGEIEVSWGTNAVGVVLTIEKNISKYRITRYKARFSEKMCNDFIDPFIPVDEVDFTFSEGELTSKYYFDEYGKKEYLCMDGIDMWGILKSI